MRNTLAIAALAAAIAVPAASSAAETRTGVCREVAVTASAPTLPQAAGHAGRQAAERAGSLARGSASAGSAPPYAGVGRMVTSCRSGSRSSCTATVVVCN